jgi:predicted regulator of Ras-like GTPase activity (Roadblock/LC7/MglB family)
MSMQGQLRDMGVAELIQHTCQDAKTARLALESGGKQAMIYFDAGEVVHAAQGELQGEPAVYAVLSWGEGSFALEAGVEPPARTIHRGYAGLLLEGAKRIDEGHLQDPAGLVQAGDFAGEAAVERMSAKEGGMSETMRALAGIEGVLGAVRVAEDGVVLEQALEGDPEKEGAVAAFVGAAAIQAGEALSLGAFKRATVGLSSGSLLVLRRGDHYVGLLLKEGASPALVASRAEAALGAEA